MKPFSKLDRNVCMKGNNFENKYRESKKKQNTLNKKFIDQK